MRDVTDAGQPITEDRATQPKEAGGWVSQLTKMHGLLNCIICSCHWLPPPTAWTASWCVRPSSWICSPVWRWTPIVPCRAIATATATSSSTSSTSPTSSSTSPPWKPPNLVQEKEPKEENQRWRSHRVSPSFVFSQRCKNLCRITRCRCNFWVSSFSRHNVQSRYRAIFCQIC